MGLKMISQGAEAKIFFNKNEGILIKERFSKHYRHSELDRKIRKRRTKAEMKILKKAAKVIDVPFVRGSEDFDRISMDFIEGKKLSDSLENFSMDEKKSIFENLGRMIGKIHFEGIIHGDITTSNIIFSDDGRVFLIDFGLGFISNKIEDKAVDLILLKQALEARHPSDKKTLFDAFLGKYKRTLERDSEKVMERINIADKRRRYRK